MKTITTLEIYKSSYNYLLNRLQINIDSNIKFVSEFGRDNAIYQHKIKKLNEQLRELHDEIVKLENIK
jgi:hypothetical protein